tara:strand:+ start:568 stop:2133 length:1566 start_codon:yes stop_codon:yes gene_type:complete
VRFLFLFFYTSIYLTSLSQQSNSTFSRNFNIFSEKNINIIQNDFHTSFKPYLFQNSDSIIINKEGSWIKRKWNNEHFLQVENDDYSLIVNPIINLEIGKEIHSKNILWTNTRGIMADGKLGEKFSYYSSFLENQSVFPRYIRNNILSESAWIVPGQGESHWTNNSIFDYAIASGHFTWEMSKYSKMQFGTGKNFIGDGYRSLILSDNAFNYPYLKIQTTAGIFQYTNLYMEHLDLIANPSEEFTYDKKYMTLHHLSANVTDRLNVGIFESVIWRNNRNPEISGFDISYLNPIIFLRPVEFSLNSSDNVLMGLNYKFKTTNNSHLYGQFVLDEFSLPNLNGNHFWGNKYSYQIGGKYFDLLGVENLVIQLENNFARPYTYSHSNTSQNYGHYYQSLAHPLGANFNELLFFVDYKYKKWEAHLQIMKAIYGGKIKNNPTSFGNDIFISNSERPSDYGIEMYQGNKTDLSFNKLTISYLFNRKTNLKIQVGYIYRILVDDYVADNTSLFFFALKSDLFNRYYDF